MAIHPSYTYRRSAAWMPQKKIHTHTRHHLRVPCGIDRYPTTPIHLCARRCHRIAACVGKGSLRAPRPLHVYLDSKRKMLASQRDAQQAERFVFPVLELLAPSVALFAASSLLSSTEFLWLQLLQCLRTEACPTLRLSSPCLSLGRCPH